MSNDISPSEDNCNEEITEVIDDSNSFFMQIPFLIDDLPLTPCEYRLYMALKRIAGARNKSSFKGTRGLAAHCNMSKNTVKKAKEKLSKPFEELNGKPLINIKKIVNADGSRGSDIIRIIDIWPEHYAKYAPVQRCGSNLTQGVGQNRDRGGSNMGHKLDISSYEDMSLSKKKTRVREKPKISDKKEKPNFFYLYVDRKLWETSLLL